ncbi:MAG: peptide chain release factor N(5)-glutamine methyltransferase [Rhodanobacteraceae bacterium]|nr:peptide chain release factor N(5)-glutamine methyltransferase [Rhodanobacteraceae bacterium]
MTKVPGDVKQTEPSAPAFTWSQLLRITQAGAPPDVAPLEAELLLAHVLGRNRAGLYARLGDAADPEIAARFGALWQRRCAGEPYAYLVGTREFHGREFLVSPDVLIPRGDTETLLEVALRCWPAGQGGVVVDAGTGSGALAISFQLERPQAWVCAVDASARALALARSNARRLGAPVSFWCGDWVSALVDCSLDLLLSNPPYLADDDPHLPGLLASGEPRSALVADMAGLGDLLRIAQAGRRVLRPGAWLWLEHGWRQGAAVRAMLEALGYAEVCTESDLGGNERVSGGRAVPGCRSSPGPCR